MGNVLAAGPGTAPGMAMPPPTGMPGMAPPPPPPAQGASQGTETAAPELPKVEESGPGTFEDLHKKCKGK